MTTIAEYENRVKEPLWCGDCGNTYDREHRELALDSRGRIRCFRPTLSCCTCRSSFRPSAPVPDDDREGWEVHNCSPCPHCGAPRKWKRWPCPCPQGLVDTAKRRADDKVKADARAKVEQEDRAKRKLEEARKKKEQEEKDRPFYESLEKQRKADNAASRKVRERKERDVDLHDRRQGVEARELARSERRLDNYDAAAAEAEATEPDAELTFASFGQTVTLAASERLPAAFVRSDGATLLYEGRGNSFFGEPSSCKSFCALMVVIQQLKAGRRCIWWDNEDRATSLAKRLQILGEEDLIGHEALAWRTGDMNLSPTAMAEALVFLGGGNGPGLVVVDSATAFLCPKDGADVNPWMESHIKPWLNAGHTPLNLDHVPKQRKDRPMGAVGSFEKLSIIKGAALFLHGTAWNAQKGGAIHLTVHKDANGELPATQSNVASTISAEWNGPTLAWTVGMPNVKAEGEDLQDELMEAFEQRGLEAVRGSQGVRLMLPGKRGRDIDSARDELLHLGLIHREKDGRAYLYSTETDT